MVKFRSCNEKMKVADSPAKNTKKEGSHHMKKYVYLFSEGNGSMRELLGGKGANLAEMTKIGLPVPQGFT
ncbi:MAG: hypothetical protein IJN58_01480, partial [Clostridia bacterium]|nr:hypothetical protein [Clostridia bacterium]